MAEQDDKTFELKLDDLKLNPISSTETAKSVYTIDEQDEDILSLKEMPPAMAKMGSFDEELDLVRQQKASENIEKTGEIEAIEDEIKDPIFKELSAPKLPELTRENRARLQMQSPNKIHFYWSFKENPFKILTRIFGGQTNYQLVARLLNQTNRREEVFPIDSDGSAWFNVDSDSRYQVEVGFYAVNRPFVRVLFSNVLQTPRKSPSPRQDYSEYFAVSADQFAKVLDVSGFQQDAYEVALAGDDIESADRATETAFSNILGAELDDFSQSHLSELRFVLLALAAGYTLEELRGQISQSLFAFLETRLTESNAEKALTALEENFEFSSEEFDEEEFIGAAVFGVSLLNVPRSLKRRTRVPNQSKQSVRLPKLSPLSSLKNN